MKILFINQPYHPDVAATAQVLHDLTRRLVAEGHEARVIASRSVYGESGGRLARRETVEGVKVRRVGVSLFGKSSTLGRVADFGLFYLAAAWRAVREPRPDVVVTLTTPPLIGLLGTLLALVKRCRHVYWAMDLYPDVVVAADMLKADGPQTRLLARLNRLCMRRADAVVVLGRCMNRRVVDQIGPPGRNRRGVITIGVWPVSHTKPAASRGVNAYRQEWNLADRFVVMYSGNLGIGHDADTMIEAARRLRDDPGIVFVFVGGGKRQATVREAVDRDHLNNVQVHAYQPLERLDELLAAADVHLVSQLDSFLGTLVPSKLYGVMLAARPTLFIGPAEAEVALTLADSRGGITTPQGDPDALVAAIQSLHTGEVDPVAMGHAARRWLDTHGTRDHLTAQWVKLLEALAENV